MDRGAHQQAEPGTILAPGDRVLVVTAGRGDRGDAAVRLLEGLGVTCPLLDLSSAGADPVKRAEHVRDAYRQLSGGRPGARRMALAAVGPAAGPVLLAAAALAEEALPCVLIVNGRFDAASPRFSALDAPVLLLADRECSRRDRAAQRGIAHQLGDGCDLVVVRALADEGAKAMRTWCSSVAPPALDRTSAPAEHEDEHEHEQEAVVQPVRLHAVAAAGPERTHRAA